MLRPAIDYVVKDDAGDTMVELSRLVDEATEARSRLLDLVRPLSSVQGALVAHLAGPEARFVTGASLTIDGGFTA
jgi:NAD(P)-dependent dehydrogenase (short-subunit alcohol dehydrogenase family)